MSFFAAQHISLAAIRASNAQIVAATAPRVAVFVGATAGIGRAALALLVSKKTPIRAYIIGRNAVKSRPLVEELQSSNPQAEIVFLEGQISLLAEVKRLCQIIRDRETSVDALCLSSGYIPFGGRVETTEGLECSLVVAYYSRMLFIQHLLPLLNRASNPRILNILDAGMETADPYLDDLELKDPKHFNFMAIAKHGGSMTTLALERIANDNPNIIVIHNHPGSVATDIGRNGWGNGDRWIVKGMLGLAQPLVRLISYTPAQSGERNVYLLTSARYGGHGVPLKDGETPGLTVRRTERGAVFLVGQKMECLEQATVLKQLHEKSAHKIMWAHTQDILKPYL